jgi:plastocyanin
MHPTGVATAAWVFAAEPSKTPFYLAGGLLAAWAVMLGAFGVSHPDFPGSAVASRLVMLNSAVLVGKLAFDKKQATVRAGRFPIRLVNDSSLPHNLTIAKGAKVLAQTKTISGGSATATANLTPGQYVFYCSVDAHRAAGMQGTLTVK